MDQLISQVKATIDPTYTWPGDPETHHFYWHGNLYPNLRNLPADENPAVFRNIAYHKGLMPKVFEAWLHEVTLPVKVPSLEIRRHRVQSWWVACNLLKAARRSLTWEEQVHARRLDVAAHPDRVKEEFNGEDIIGEAYMRQTLEENFERFVTHLIQNEEIPPEFRLVETEEPHKIIENIGKFVARKSVNLVPLIKAA